MVRRTVFYITPLMNPALVISIICCYFLGLLVISYLTTRHVDNASFYHGNRRSPWYIISIAMIGTSISGVTFISVPGWVLTDQFSYIQMVMGFVVGYIIVAKVLLPVYYKMNLTTIYTYLQSRFGRASYKTGSVFFLISRTLGSAFRLYVVAVVLQKTLFDAWHVPFSVTVLVTIFLIFIYTRKGGVKTIIWTDTIQTVVLISTVVLCIAKIAHEMNFSFAGMCTAIEQSQMARIFYFDEPTSKLFFWKQFLAGVFTVITMTGLDQDQMQKNLSCKSLKEAQKNMYWYGCSYLPINIIFLALGVLLVLYARQHGVEIPANGDDLFPMMATGRDAATGALFFGPFIGILFILGIVSAAYSSADSALTALTTSLTIDILEVRQDDPLLQRKRTLVHIGIAILLGLVILLFRAINNESVIKSIYTVAGYTYGPLLGLFAFGLCTRWQVKDRCVPWIAVLSPILCYILSRYSAAWFGGYKIGFEILIINGLFTFIGLWLCRKKALPAATAGAPRP